MKRYLYLIFLFTAFSAIQAFAQPCTSPPAADICSNAPMVCNLNNYCGNTTGNTSGAPTTICGFSIENNAFIAFTATQANVSFTITSGTCTSGSGIQAVILQTTNCATFTVVSNCANNITGSATVTSSTPLVIGQTYYVMVDGFAGANCGYTITNAVGTGGTTGSINASNNVTICNGQSTTLTATGSTNISWSPATGLSSTTGGSVTASPSTTTLYYAFEASNPCIARDSVLVTVNNINAPSLTAIDAACTCDGQASLLPSPTGIGVAPYTYSWSNGMTNDSISGLCPGGYTVTLTDANGCKATENFTIGVTGGPVSTISKQNVLCAGGATGTALVTPASGTPPYFYSWSNGDTDSLATGLIAGTYTIVVSDINGCQSTETVVITEPAALTITPSQQNISCLGGSNGSATATVSGGTAPYLYSWSNGVGGSTASNLTAGNYTVTVTDINGCTAQQSYTLTEPSTGISLTPFVTNAICFGGNDGSITLSATGGSGIYSFSWDPSVAGNTNIAGSLSAGTYIGYVTDSQGCNGSATAVVGEPTQIAISFQVQQVRCKGNSDGGATAVVSGGTPSVNGYTYSWSNGTGLASTSNLATGTYTITVTDSLGCSMTKTVFIPEPTNLSLNITKTDATCATAGNGSAQVTVIGGTPGVNGYSYSWTGGGTTQAIHNLGQGEYFVTVTDSNGCTALDSVQISSLSAIAVTFSSDDPSCTNFSDGWIKATATGGSGTYTYEWSNGSAADSIYALTAGTYTLTVHDTGSMTPATIYEETFETGMNWNLNVPAGNNDPNSNTWYHGGAFGSITCGSPGVADSVIFIGKDGQAFLGPVYNPSTETHLSAVSPLISTVGYGSPLELDFKYMGFGNVADRASIDVSVDGGQSWINLQTGLTGIPCGTSSNWQRWNGILPALAENNPKVQLRFVWNNDGDNIGAAASFAANDIKITAPRMGVACDSTFTHTITNPQPIVISVVNKQDAVCNTNGSIMVAGNGGTAPITFSWSNGQTGASASNLLPNTDYSVTATDANGCIADTTLQIIRKTPAFNVDVTTNNAICLSKTGSAVANVGGEDITGPFTFNWFPGNTTQNPAVNLTGGKNYQLTILDANGCQFDTVIHIGVTNVNLDLNLNITENVCGKEVGKATAIPTSGTGPYTYSWDSNTGNQTTMQALALGTGSYMVTVTDANGCVSDTMAIIPEVLGVNASFSTSTNNGIAPLEVQFSNTSIGADTYQWNFADGSGSTDTSPLHQFAGGEYQVVLYAYAGANNQCADTAMVTITVLDKLQIFIPNVFAPNGLADNKTFRITGEGIKEYHLQVFNRWGKVVFESFDITNSWNGLDESAGTYYYVLNLKGTNDQEVPYSGFVTLVK